MSDGPDRAPWAPPPVAGAFDLAESARRMGACAWVEERSFEIVGGWAASTLPAEVRLTLSEHSHHHAWRARLLRERLPEIPGLAADDVVAPADPAVAEALAVLAGGDTPPGVAHLVAHYRVVVPRLAAAYTVHLDRCSAVADASIARVLRLSVDDLGDDWRRGETMVQALSTPSTAIETALRDRVEGLLVAAGGVCGASTLHPG